MFLNPVPSFVLKEILLMMWLTQCMYNNRPILMTSYILIFDQDVVWFYEPIRRALYPQSHIVECSKFSQTPKWQNSGHLQNVIFFGLNLKIKWEYINDKYLTILPLATSRSFDKVENMLFSIMGMYKTNRYDWTCIVIPNSQSIEN